MKQILGLMLALLAVPVLGGEKDVNVVNVQPIPVVVENDAAGLVSVSVRNLVEVPTARITQNVFEVPAGKVLIVDYVSIYLDVVVGNRPNTGLRIAGNLSGTGAGTDSLVNFELGYMEEFERTSRGTPNFIVARNVKAYFSEGTVQCVADTHFAGSGLDFGLARCSLAGRLIDAP